jgi:serine/threonine protein kinase
MGDSPDEQAPTRADAPLDLDVDVEVGRDEGALDMDVDAPSPAALASAPAAPAAPEAASAGGGGPASASPARPAAPRAGEAPERKITPENVRRRGVDFTGYEFGSYRVLGEIARGGMGVLFRAKQLRPIAADPKLKLPDEFALKIILTRAGAAAKAADIERFIREIRVLITLQHPNIVRIWDAGKDQGLHYYAMELIRGESLKDLVRERPLPLVMSLSVVRDVGSALDALHAAGMLHRDVKPANILVDKSASPFRPVLIDFGLIKGKFAGELTAGKGEVAGTPAYMSPEATDPGTAHEAGPASDLYSLGAVLYYLVTRRSPFLGVRAEEVIAQVQRDPVKPPRAIVPDLPEAVERIILRCLAKRQEDRFPSMRDLIAALDAEIQGARKQIRLENTIARYRKKIFG